MATDRTARAVGISTTTSDRVLSARRAFAWTLAAAAAGRLVTVVVLWRHWQWQPPYHLAYLQPPDFYDAATREYLVPNMPGYPAFLRAIAATGLNLYVGAPAVQTVLQVLAIGWLTATLDRVAAPRRAIASPLLAFAIGADPWLCEAAIAMQPAAITAALFIVIVERAVAFAGGVLSSRALPRAAGVVAVAAAVCAVGTYFRSDFATVVVLVPIAIALTAWIIGAATITRAAAFGIVTSAAALAIVVATLVPRALWLRTRTGTFVMTTHATGGILWYGLGEIRNPWGVPNPETGDAAIEAFGRSRGFPSAFASARTSTFFLHLFREHVAERPGLYLRLSPRAFIVPRSVSRPAQSAFKATTSSTRRSTRCLSGSVPARRRRSCSSRANSAAGS